jgi:hypothetical protein
VIAVDKHADRLAMALSHVAGLKAAVSELQAMTRTLEHLAEHCQGNDRPDCPIIENLAELTSPAVTERSARSA